MHFHPMESQVHPEKRTRTEEAEGAEKEERGLTSRMNLSSMVTWL